MARDALIIQFTTSGEPADLELLFGFSESLSAGLIRNRSGEVDGNDFGEGRMNVFVYPRTGYLSACVDAVKAYLKYHKLLHRGIIVRRTKSENHHVLWPEGYDGNYERC